MKVEVSDRTVEIIESITGMTIEKFLEQTKNEMLNKYQDGNRIKVKEAAQIMGKSEQFVRIGLQRGILPFGVAIKTSNNYTYYISPKKFNEYVGYYHSDNDSNEDSSD